MVSYGDNDAAQHISTAQPGVHLGENAILSVFAAAAAVASYFPRPDEAS